MKDQIVLKLQELFLEIYNDIEPKTRNHYHTVLQRAIKDLAKDFGYKGIMEYRINEIKLFEEKKGKIDIVWENNNEIIAAIEISANMKPKTIMKLLSSKAQYLIYFYYSKKNKDYVNSILEQYDPKKEIVFIHIPLNLTSNKSAGIKKEFYI